MAGLAGTQPARPDERDGGFDRFCAPHPPARRCSPGNWRPPGAWIPRRAPGAPTGPARSASSASTFSWPAWTPSSCRRRGSPAGPGPAAHVYRRGAGRVLPGRRLHRPRVPLPVPRVHDPGRLPAAPQYGAAPDRGPPPAPPRRRHRERGGDDRAVQAEQGPQCPPRRGPGRAAGPLRPAGGPAAPGPGVVLPRQERTPADPAVADRRLPPVLRAGRRDRPGIDSLRAPAQLRGPHADALGRGGPGPGVLAALPGGLHGPREVLLDSLVCPPAARAPRGGRPDPAAGIIPAVAS